MSNFKSIFDGVTAQTTKSEMLARFEIFEKSLDALAFSPTNYIINRSHAAGNRITASGGDEPAYYPNCMDSRLAALRNGGWRTADYDRGFSPGAMLYEPVVTIFFAYETLRRYRGSIEDWDGEENRSPSWMVGPAFMKLGARLDYDFAQCSR
jgi:hypothetical protein